MTITVAPDPTFAPPRNAVTLGIPAGLVMSAVQVWRNEAGVQTPLRVQPSAGFDTRVVYDYEAPYGSPVTYSWSTTYTDPAAYAAVWTEAWAALSSWTAVGSSWAVSGGTLVWTGPDSATASLSRSVTPGKYRVQFTAPPTGLARIDFGGFYLDVKTSRIWVNGSSTAYTRGTGAFTVDVTGTGVVVTTTAGSFTISGDVQIDRIALIGPNTSPEWLTKWGSYGTTSNSQFKYIRDIAIDPTNGLVYVLDRDNNRVQKFSNSGTYILKWGSSGTGNGQFSSPRGITVDSSGNVYVADSGNNRIQKFTSTGAYTTKWGTVGSADGQLSDPRGIAADSAGNVYVADVNNQRIQKFTSAGVFSAKWGSSGSGDGQFAGPAEVAITGTSLYVTDFGNKRVQQFTTAGVFVSKWSIPDGTGPSSIATDAAGYVYVGDDSNLKLRKYSSAGVYLTEWGGASGTANGQFKTATYGIAVDSAGNVFVGDVGNFRVQKFSAAPTVIDDLSLFGQSAPVGLNETSDPITLAPDSGWMVHPANPALSFRLTPVAIQGIDPIDNKSAATVHQILGQARPIITTSGPRLADNLQMRLLTYTRDEEVTLTQLLQDQSPILIRFPSTWDPSWVDGWFHVGDLQRARFANTKDPLRVVTLPLQAVESPVVSQANVGWSWAALAAEFPTWASVAAAFETWGDVLINNRKTGY